MSAHTADEANAVRRSPLCQLRVIRRPERAATREHQDDIHLVPRAHAPANRSVVPRGRYQSAACPDLRPSIRLMAAPEFSSAMRWRAPLPQPPKTPMNPTRSQWPCARRYSGPEHKISIFKIYALRCSPSPSWLVGSARDCSLPHHDVSGPQLKRRRSPSNRARALPAR